MAGRGQHGGCARRAAGPGVRPGRRTRSPCEVLRSPRPSRGLLAPAGLAPRHPRSPASHCCPKGQRPLSDWPLVLPLETGSQEPREPPPRHCSGETSPQPPSAPREKTAGTLTQGALVLLGSHLRAKGRRMDEAGGKIINERHKPGVQ